MPEPIETAASLMETPETPIIVAGGPSSSTLLNTLRDGLIADVLELDRRTADQTDQISRSHTIFQTQLTALTARLSSLEARLPSTPSQSWLADFFTEDLVDPVHNTAEVDTIYGQATLPILSTQEKLVGEDTRGDVWVPKDTQIHYAYSSSVPAETDWLSDDQFQYALDSRSDTAWWRERGSEGSVWIKIRVPVNLNANKMANSLRLHPFPALSTHLVSVEHKNPAGSWTTADLTYLEGWSQSDNRVNWYGNVRLLLPQSQVTEIRLKLTTSSYWGFSLISLQQLDFAASAILGLDYGPYNTGTLDTAVLLGKDSDILEYLSHSIQGDQVTVNLVQTTTNSTPVLTGVEVTRD